MNKSNRSLRDAAAVAISEPHRALAILDAALVEARSDSLRSSEVAALAKHAGVIAAGAREIERARAYFEEAATVAPEESAIHWALGDALRELGCNEEAHQAFTRSLSIATTQGDHDAIRMAEKALKALGKPCSG